MTNIDRLLLFSANTQNSTEPTDAAEPKKAGGLAALGNDKSRPADPKRSVAADIETL